jgi:hypothetical protein
MERDGGRGWSERSGAPGKLWQNHGTGFLTPGRGIQQTESVSDRGPHSSMRGRPLPPTHRSRRDLPHGRVNRGTETWTGLHARTRPVGVLSGRRSVSILSGGHRFVNGKDGVGGPRTENLEAWVAESAAWLPRADPARDQYAGPHCSLY